MATIELTARQTFNRDIYNLSRDLTTREFTGTPAWVIGVEIKGIADSYDISNLTLEFLENELQLRKSHYFLDSHNWSDLARGVANTSIQIITMLVVRKGA